MLNAHVTDTTHVSECIASACNIYLRQAVVPSANSSSIVGSLGRAVKLILRVDWPGFQVVTVSRLETSVKQLRCSSTGRETHRIAQDVC